MRALSDYLGGLTLAGGDHDGEPLEVLPWQRRFLAGAFRVSGDAAVTCGRGNGKSAFVAGIAAAVVDPAGPLTGRRAEVVCVASSFTQGKIIFEDVLAFLGDRYDVGDRVDWRRQDSVNNALLECRATGARIRCLGSDPGRAHGIRPSLILCDEPAQWPPATAERMLAALRTSLGKTPGARLIALGTRPADSGHWFARMLRAADYAQIHAARPDDPPFWARTIRRANPSLAHLPSLQRQLATEAETARRDPDALASWRALRLNGGASDTAESVLIEADTWASLTDGAEPVGRYVLALDLGQNAAMSAAAAYWPTGRLECLAVFPELPALGERGLSDGVGDLYRRMAERGELLQAGRRVSDVRALLGEVLSRWGRPAVIVADRWREAELRQALEAVRFPLADLAVRGQGFYHGGEDVRRFRRACLGGHVRPERSLLLTSALAEARVVGDAAGNWKLSKSAQGGRRQKARDDAAAAAILAVAEGARRWHTEPVVAPRRRRTALAG